MKLFRKLLNATCFAFSTVALVSVIVSLLRSFGLSVLETFALVFSPVLLLLVLTANFGIIIALLNWAELLPLIKKIYFDD